MISKFHLLTLFAAFFSSLSTGFADEARLLDEKSQAEGPQENKVFVTVEGLTVAPLSGREPQLVDENGWPDLPAPTRFNTAFDRPSSVWRVAGGYLASFDAGEFGGALFYASPGADKWRKILDGRVSFLQQLEGDTYVATGGLAHLDQMKGRAYLITRGKVGRWKTKVVFKTSLGVPKVVGTAFAAPDGSAQADKLIVFQVESPWGVAPLFGVTKGGLVHYPGDRAKN